MPSGLGELFVLGFRGLQVPEWLRAFAEEHGLGGAILFDRDVPSGSEERNVATPEQLKLLCAELHALPGRPRVCVDQEGGRVRRLKPERGFAPLPSARAFAQRSLDERRALARDAFAEMGALGIDLDLAPVVDLDLNPDNPGIGALERAYSADPARVAENALLVADAARAAGVDLCLKHYPGLGAATTDSHTDRTEIPEPTREQLALFETLAAEIPGRAVLLSHAVVNTWDAERAASLSPRVVGDLRARVGDEALLLSDDLQMRGARGSRSLAETCVAALAAGVDLLLVGNNLAHEEAGCLEAVRALGDAVARDPALAARADAARARLRATRAG
jgi:beta-N-acetylhexosaminidase